MRVWVLGVCVCACMSVCQCASVCVCVCACVCVSVGVPGRPLRRPLISPSLAGHHKGLSVSPSPPKGTMTQMGKWDASAH